MAVRRSRQGDISYLGIKITFSKDNRSPKEAEIMQMDPTTVQLIQVLERTVSSGGSFD